jgi:threonine dehydrogenase-like Zn-dependent dehydrogenase
MSPADLPRAIALARAGRVELGSLVSHRFPIDQAAAAFEVLAAQRGLKVVINPTRSVPSGG